MDRQEQIDDRISELCEHFEEYLNIENETGRPDSPGRYFHVRALSRLTKAPTLASVFSDVLFFDYLYATLVAWNMDTRGAKLRGYRDFVSGLQAHQDAIVKLNQYTLAGLAGGRPDDTAWPECIKGLWEVVQVIGVGEAESKLVAGTKALHHLLPNLLPPIDRGGTLKFFFGHGGTGGPRPYKFIETMLRYMDIYTVVSDVINGLVDVETWNSSTTKIIDNAIRGFWLAKKRSA